MYFEITNLKPGQVLELSQRMVGAFGSTIRNATTNATEDFAILKPVDVVSAAELDQAKNMIMELGKQVALRNKVIVISATLIAITTAGGGCLLYRLNKERKRNRILERVTRKLRNKVQMLRTENTKLENDKIIQRTKILQLQNELEHYQKIMEARALDEQELADYLRLQSEWIAA